MLRPHAGRPHADDGTRADESRRLAPVYGGVVERRACERREAKVGNLAPARFFCLAGGASLEWRLQTKWTSANAAGRHTARPNLPSASSVTRFLEKIILVAVRHAQVHSFADEERRAEAEVADERGAGRHDRADDGGEPQSSLAGVWNALRCPNAHPSRLPSR